MRASNSSSTKSTGGTLPLPDIVNYGYFWCSLSIWLIMPLLYLPLGMEWDYIQTCVKTNGEIRYPKCNCLERSRFLLPIQYPFKIIRGYFISVLRLYLNVPVMDIYWGFSNLFCHEQYQGTFDEAVHFTWPAFKLFEQFGEAVPQFVIAVTFFANNAHWLDQDDLLLGYVTMTLSAGSILIGVWNGIMNPHLKDHIIPTMKLAVSRHLNPTAPTCLYM